jgi:hypothetical protein
VLANLVVSAMQDTVSLQAVVSTTVSRFQMEDTDVLILMVIHAQQTVEAGVMVRTALLLTVVDHLTRSHATTVQRVALLIRITNVLVVRRRTIIILAMAALLEWIWRFLGQEITFSI